MELIFGFVLGMFIAIPAELLIVFTLHPSDGVAMLSGLLVGTVSVMAATAFLSR